MLISTLFAVSSAALIVFGVALARRLRELGGSVDRLSSIAWAGTVIAATGIMAIVSITFTAAVRSFSRRTSSRGGDHRVEVQG